MNDQNVETRVRKLVALKITNKLSEKQSKELDVLSSIPGVKMFIETLTKEDYLVKEINTISRLSDRQSLIWENMKPHIVFRKRIITMWQRLAIAASFLVVISVGAYLFHSYTRNAKPEVAAKKQDPLPKDILPPEGTAVLTLADGKTVALNDKADRQMIATQGNSSVIKDKNELVYSRSNGNVSSEIIMNKVATGTGGNYKLTLADGSVVWLNSKSSLEFAPNFSSTERQVKLTGQGYFNVAKDNRRPFLVTTENNTTIKVLGTTFDINNFDKKRINSSINTTTTLFSGAVMVSHNGSENKLAPGEQAIISETGNFSVKKTQDEDHVLAWLKKKFSFQDASIESIMDELSRNYDIKEIVYEGKVTGSFNGIISKEVPLSEVLRIFSATEYVHFQIVDGNKIIVKP